MAEPAKRRGPRPAEERFRRLLIMLPWLMEQGVVTVAEAAKRFRLTEAEVIKDVELAAMCGVSQSPEDLLSVFIDDNGNIVADVPHLFTKPMRLTQQEVFALLASAEAASAVPGADPDGTLQRALDKVKAKLGTNIEVDFNVPPLTAAVRDAVREGRVLSIRYWTPSRDEVTERRITPRSVQEWQGDFYVVADDERSGEERIFRIDRIRELVATGERVPLRRVTTTVGDWFGADVPTVSLVLETDAQWVAERYPVRGRTELPGGRLQVKLPVASERWLARLLLRLGTTARVDSPESQRTLGVDTAKRVLARYR